MRGQVPGTTRTVRVLRIQSTTLRPRVFRGKTPRRGEVRHPNNRSRTYTADPPQGRRIICVVRRQSLAPQGVILRVFNCTFTV